ncbi:E3 SUMO-protein ligase KIAA1586-like [Eleginops maclovinus]|uniref:E3 SUMO-protein ligase KIAA1586-like n=1 Tax=Eleginops maclovinus TaxID=56733 RepID=UPI00308015D0
MEEDDDVADDHPTCASSSSLPAARDRGGEVAAVVRRLPDGWTSQQWSEWITRLPWLFSKDGSIGCTLCRDAKSLLLSTDKGGVHLSEEWMNRDVSSKTKNNLRKKIYKHRDSVAHNRAVELAETRKQAILPNQILAINGKLLEETSNAFRSAYMIAKERMAFKKLPPVMQLQEINGAKVGAVHRSDKSCAEIIGHIALEMQKKFVCNVKKAQSKISITIDESSVHGRAYMIVYVRCDVTGKGDVDNVFLGLKELVEGTDAESIYNSLREALRVAGFDDEFLSNNLISIATDGASVLTGKNSGVIARLKQDFPKIQSIHCLCHRLELAVHDSLKLVAGCNHFEIFVSKLYSLYNQSAKNARLLEEAAAELNMQLLKIGQIFTIRWVSSSFRTVKAVWNNYPALARHFKIASEDPSRNDTERKKFLGLHKQLSNAGFVADLACMKDMLRELQALSLRLQQRDIVSANCQIQQCIDVLSALKECGGKPAQKAEDRITQRLFKGVELVECSGKIKRGQFYQSVIDNLKKRMPESDLVNMLKPLNKRFWPQDRNALIMYGEKEIRALAKELGESASEAVQELRDWKLQDAAPAPGKTLEKLSIASRTYLPTSSECERGFSAMNDTDSKTRNRLREASTSSLLFVDLNGPPLERFDPTPFITSWLKSGHRLSTSWASGPRAKATEPRPLWSLLC